MRTGRSVIAWLAELVRRFTRRREVNSDRDAASELNDWLGCHCDDDLERIDCQLAVELVRDLSDDPDVRPLLDDCRRLADRYRSGGPVNMGPRQQAARGRIPVFAGAFAVIAVMAVVLITLPEATRYETGIGEQRTVIAGDGTAITLNTDTELVIRIDEEVRQILLERGQAFFSVMPDPLRPFEVVAGDGVVRAVGTSFDVAMHGHPGQVRVAVVEGSVEIRPREAESLPVTGGDPVPKVSSGELATYWGSGAVAKVTRSSVKSVTAWRDGKLDFNDQRLADALNEHNRYTTQKIVLGDDRLADLRISGTVRIRDTDGFVFLLSESLGLRVVRKEDVVVLLGGTGSYERT